jgi:hypothetical protein
MTTDELTVTCNTCGTQAPVTDGTQPHASLQCGCCPLPHDHAGLGCRTVTITATAGLAGATP